MQIKQTLAIEISPVTLNVTCCLDEHRYDLNPMYLAQPEIPEDTWPPVSSKKFINLALIKQRSHQLQLTPVSLFGGTWMTFSSTMRKLEYYEEVIGDLI